MNFNSGWGLVEPFPPPHSLIVRFSCGEAVRSKPCLPSQGHCSFPLTARARLPPRLLLVCHASGTRMNIQQGKKKNWLPPQDLSLCWSSSAALHNPSGTVLTFCFEAWQNQGTDTLFFRNETVDLKEESDGGHQMPQGADQATRGPHSVATPLHLTF